MLKSTLKPFHEEPLIRQFLTLTQELPETSIFLEEEIAAIYASLAKALKEKQTIYFRGELINQLIKRYRAEHNEFLLTLIENGVKINSETIISLISVANQIPEDTLKKLLNTHNQEITPNIGRKNIFATLAAEGSLNTPLLDYIFKDKKLDPTIKYPFYDNIDEFSLTSKQMSGIELAELYQNIPLLVYYKKLGYDVNFEPDEKLLQDLTAYEAFSFESLPENPSEEKFSQTTKEFLKNEAMTSLRGWLNKPGVYRFTALEALFFTKPEIAAFMLREIVTVENNIPYYAKDEQEIYNILEENKRLLIPYRSDASRITKEEANKINKEIKEYKVDFGAAPTTSAFMSLLLDEELPKSSTIKLLNLHDIYSLEKRLLFLKKIKFKSDEKLVYIINAGAKDAHAFATLSILDPKSQEIKSHILINSSQSKKYFNYLADKINHEHSYLNLKKIPIFDASLHIQTEKEDYFCGTYAIEIARAVYLSLLEEDSLENELSIFAKQPTEDCWETVNQKLQLAIKKRLPMFYDSNDGEFKEIQLDQKLSWHIEKRFHYGRLFLKREIENADSIIQEGKKSIPYLLECKHLNLTRGI